MTAQHLLFDDLPETERARKPARRSRATTVAAPVAVDVVREAVPAPLPASLMPAAPAAVLPLTPPVPVPPPAFEPAALTNPELRALVQAIPDLRLSFLLVEAARELRRRVAPDRMDEESDDTDGGAAEPNPALLRAARQAVGELSGDE